MSVFDVQDSLVQVSEDDLTYATITDISSWNATHGSEGAQRRRVFGQTAPYVRPGGDVDTYDIAGLLNLADTNGQNILRQAKDNRTNVYLRVMPGGADTGAIGYKQLCQVLEYGDAGDAEGDLVECSFSLEGVGAKADVTIP